MKKKWLLLNLVGLFIAPVLLQSAENVMAEEKTETEMNSEVQQEKNVPVIEMDETGRYIDPILDSLITEEKVNSSLFIDVYERYYKKILHDYQLGDLLYVNDQATTYEEFMESFQIPDVNPTVEENEEGNTLVYYLFEDMTDETTPRMVELSLHFSKGQLLSVALANLAIQIDPNNVDSQAIQTSVIEEWFSDDTPLTLADIGHELKRITGISESATSDSRINTVVTQTESKENQPMVDYLFLLDGYLVSSLPESLQISIEYPGARLFSYTTFMTQEVLGNKSAESSESAEETESTEESTGVTN